MTRVLLTAVLLLAGARASLAQAPAGQMLNLSCVEGLVAIGMPQLAGVFSFVPEKDAPAAFGDLIVHDKKALKKYVAKLEKDMKEAGGISAWDHQAVAFAQQVYASPLAETIEKPGASVLARLDTASRAPTMSLQDMTARRRK